MTTPSAPGETIADLIEERGHDKLCLADDLGLGLDELEMLLTGAWPIDDALARRLSEVLGPPGGFWQRREAHYRASLAGQNIPFLQMCEALTEAIEVTHDKPA